MKAFFDSISHQIKGVLVMIAGLLLLLHTLGIIERGISAVLIAVSIGLMFYGFVFAGFYKKFIKDRNNH